MIQIYPSIKKNHILSIRRFFYLNVPLYALAYVLTPYTKILFSILGGVRRKPHIDPDVQNGYILALDKLVPDEECAQVRSELSQYISEHGILGTLHATKDRERLDPIRWWKMYGSGATYLHKLGEGAFTGCQ